MKALKKISTVFLALCLTISCFSLTAFAADGRISFSDPSTAVGDDVEITVAVRSEGNSMNTVEVDIDYDTEYLKFRSGEGATEGEIEGNTGALILSSDEGGTDVVFTVTFQALKEGSTSVTIESYRITGQDGNTMDFTMGNSAVTIAEGDSSKIENSGDTNTSGTESKTSSTNTKTATVEVDGVTYTLTGDFPDSEIPTGYVRADVSLGGEELPMLKSETSGAVLAYLVNQNDIGDFFYFDQEADNMWPYAEVAISDSTTLLLLSDTSQVKLPEAYKQATLTINNKDFPTWQDTSNDQGYYIIYGLGSDGNKGYYRYDSKQGTYQRFEVTEAEDTEDETPALASGFLGNIEQFVMDHLLLCIIGAAILLLILLIILIVVGVKLHNRNSELDELYDEYGIDEEPEPEPEPVKKSSKKEQKKAKKAKAQEEFEEDYDETLYGGEDMDEDDFEEEDLEEEDFDDDDYDEEILGEEDLEEDLDEDDFFDEDYDSDEDPLDLSQNLMEATGELNIVEDEDEEEEEEPEMEKTVVLDSPEQVKASRKKASRQAEASGRASQGASSAQSEQSARSEKSVKHAQSAKAAKAAKSARVAETAEEEEPATRKASAKAATARKAKATKTKSVDEDLENVPEDEDIFAGYEKREELTLDDLWGDEKGKKKKGHQEDDDSFKVDFIDLD